jgi:hypothetical protein
MPHKSRIDAPGALNHIMAGGIDRRDDEAPRSPAWRDLRSATTPFGGISVSLQQAARYSGEGE